MRRWNIIVGRRMAYLRWQRKWTQEILAARLQCEGVDISRMGVARIELGHVRVDEEVLKGLLIVFELPIIEFFPKDVRDLDAKFAARGTPRWRKKRLNHAES